MIYKLKIFSKKWSIDLNKSIMRQNIFLNILKTKSIKKIRPSAFKEGEEKIAISIQNNFYIDYDISIIWL